MFMFIPSASATTRQERKRGFRKRQTHTRGLHYCGLLTRTAVFFGMVEPLGDLVLGGGCVCMLGALAPIERREMGWQGTVVVQTCSKKCCLKLPQKKFRCATKSLIRGISFESWKLISVPERSL